MALTDSDERLKRTPDNDRITMKVKADRVLVTDVPADALNILKKRTQNQDINSIEETELELNTSLKNK